MLWFIITEPSPFRPLAIDAFSRAISSIFLKAAK